MNSMKIFWCHFVIALGILSATLLLMFLFLTRGTIEEWGTVVRLTFIFFIFLATIFSGLYASAVVDAHINEWNDITNKRTYAVAINGVEIKVASVDEVATVLTNFEGSTAILMIGGLVAQTTKRLMDVRFWTEDD